MMHETIAEAERERVLKAVKVVLREMGGRTLSDSQVYEWVWLNNVWSVDQAIQVIRSQQERTQ